MAYVVDYSKLPRTLLRELINYTNGIELMDEQITIGNLRPSELEGYNTAVDVTWVTTADMVGTVKVNFNRIDLGHLFSLTGLSVKELNVTVDDDHKVVLLDSQEKSAFFNEVKRRYGLDFTTFMEQFTVDNVGGKQYFKPSADNVAYTGQVELVVEQSLATRVAKLELNGFTLTDPTDIEQFVVNKELGTMWYSAKDQAELELAATTNKTWAKLVTYGLDMTSYKSLLAVDSATGGFSQYEALLTHLSAFGVPAFDNPTTSTPIVDAPTSAVLDSRASYDRVVTVYVNSEEMVGTIYLHYNLQ